VHIEPVGHRLSPTLQDIVGTDALPKLVGIVVGEAIQPPLQISVGVQIEPDWQDGDAPTTQGLSFGAAVVIGVLRQPARASGRMEKKSKNFIFTIIGLGDYARNYLKVV